MTLKSKMKYIREENALRDKSQLRLDTLTFMDSPLAQQQIELNSSQNVMCCFCLYQDTLRKFLIPSKSGFHKGLGLCPQCKQKSQLRTLVNMPNMSAKKYAEFVYNYVSSGFWQKCDFHVWARRLNLNIHLSCEFWNRYNELKGNTTFKEDY